MASTRPYDNSRRAERARATSDAIVGALCDLLVDERPGNVSMPAVAKRAGVSVRTVYSHFPTKDDLFEAINPYVDRHYFGDGGIGPSAPDPDATFGDQVRSRVPALAAAIPLFTALQRAGVDDDQHAAARIRSRQARLTATLRAGLPDLPDADVARLASALSGVVSWQVVQRLQRSGLEVDEAADLLGWIADAMLDKARAGGAVGTSAPPDDGASMR